MYNQRARAVVRPYGQYVISERYMKEMTRGNSFVGAWCHQIYVPLGERVIIIFEYKVIIYKGV